MCHHLADIIIAFQRIVAAKFDNVRKDSFHPEKHRCVEMSSRVTCNMRLNKLFQSLLFRS